MIVWEYVPVWDRCRGDTDADSVLERTCCVTDGVSVSVTLNVTLLGDAVTEADRGCCVSVSVSETESVVDTKKETDSLAEPSYVGVLELVRCCVGEKVPSVSVSVTESVTDWERSGECVGEPMECEKLMDWYTECVRESDGVSLAVSFSDLVRFVSDSDSVMLFENDSDGESVVESEGVSDNCGDLVSDPVSKKVGDGVGI